MVSRKAWEASQKKVGRTQRAPVEAEPFLTQTSGKGIQRAQRCYKAISVSAIASAVLVGCDRHAVCGKTGERTHSSKTPKITKPHLNSRPRLWVRITLTPICQG